MTSVRPDCGLARLQRLTPARVRLDPTATPTPVGTLIDFQESHAAARDAIHAAADWAALERALHPLEVRRVHSMAGDRATYLRRPDLGRRLREPAALPPGPFPLVVVIGDGLSAPALRHAPVVVSALQEAVPEIAAAPVVLAEGARVALGDDIASRMNAAMCLMLIGERPGLSVSDSLGAYLTMAPRRGTRDSARNCVSNIHGQGGIAPGDAARRLAWLIGMAQELGCTGVALKDESGPGLPAISGD